MARRQVEQVMDRACRNLALYAQTLEGGRRHAYRCAMPKEELEYLDEERKKHGMNRAEFTAMICDRYHNAWPGPCRMPPGGNSSLGCAICFDFTAYRVIKSYADMRCMSVNAFIRRALNAYKEARDGCQGGTR